MTHVSHYNLGVTGGLEVTLSGLSFAADVTPTAAISEACATTSWVSSTYAACRAPYSAGGSLAALQLTAAGVVGTFVTGFSYDSPTVSNVTPYYGSFIGGSAVTIHGSNFGGVDGTA